ncbi:serine--tRNA ligase [Desulfovibrio legallii]|uniref:Serine--tRNA ligase n=1 Tax=Desulfovibrio legallii TaxID=571438 RepID=A0A1G7LG62_9BACT|nr:serine--tRNA ligase [Desulfovibrio legallii]SDF48366.1 seryl-tRNA synthetase [Desulfovibrio legallii]
MLDLKLLQRQPDLLAKALADRHSGLDIQEFLALDARRRNLLTQVEGLKQQRNAASTKVAELKRKGEDAAALLAESTALADRIKELDGETAQAKAEVEAWLMRVPNLPDTSVPVGKDETENVEVSRWGTPPVFDFPPREHGELGVALDGLDFERAARLTGSRFVVMRGWAARLERALVNFFLDQHTRHEDYIEVCPPYMVNRATMTGTGQLPKFEEDLFKLRENDYYLIPTAEVPLTNLHAGEVLDETDLPRAYCAATPCFRSEAGSAGKDTRGIIRMHQFTKVEMVRFSHPEDSFNQLEILRGHACRLLEMLELPYRVITLCTGDMGFSAAKTYDLEVWLPAQNTYREISSCSNCTDFQARRAGIRFKPKGGKAAYLHTLNGSGLPTGRTIAALLENGQQKDGSVRLPKALAPYMNGVECIEPRNGNGKQNRT